MRFPLAILLLFVFGCSDSNNTNYLAAPSYAARAVGLISRAESAKPGSESDEKQASDLKSPSPSQGASDQIPSLIIRNADVSVEVQQLDSAIVAVTRLAASVGGFIANSSLESGQNQVRRAVLQVKVPAANFERALSGLKPIGKVETVNTTAEDVTEEFVDVSARVANAKRLEERLVKLLEQRTGKLEDVLSVERELARVREEIERYEGRIKYLKTRAAISTLNVGLHEQYPVLGNTPGHNIIGESFKSAWRNFVSFIAAFISSLGVLIPLAALAYFVWLGYRRWKVRK